MNDLESALIIRPVTDNCDSIYQRRRHIVIAISPFNKFFSENNIYILLKWVVDNFNGFNIFIPEEITVYTMLALGYSEIRSRKKIK